MQADIGRNIPPSLNFMHVNPLQDNKILDWSKLKQNADDIWKCI